MFSVGDRVLAATAYGEWLPASVAEFRDGHFAVVFDDGFRDERVAPDRLRALGVRAGAEPAAPALVGSFRIPDRPASPDRFAPAAVATPPLPPAYQPGERVFGNWSDLGFWHRATVLAVDAADGSVRLEYDDGYVEQVHPRRVSRNGGGGSDPRD